MLFVMLSKYHYWAYQQLYSVIEQVDDENYHKENGLFFNSIHGTLNHLLLVDRLWYSRFNHQPCKITDLGLIIIKDRNELKQAIFAQVDLWIEFTKKAANGIAPATLTYHDTKGIFKVADYQQTLCHAFNHGTHHRGQISVALTQLGKLAPEMDLIYFKNT
ncbi:MAG: hypothetical protein A3E87_07320 [Gammaproteobacteria bacterium RIFCSPHIGHO2_12_FULL_35_23]|nr:MAG: hypothetical protein A3E87_07320 [Gammaproteobacteria bacterium RIFCSPHIGHO2_12_FULL_35_23]